MTAEDKTPRGPTATEMHQRAVLAETAGKIEVRAHAPSSPEGALMAAYMATRKESPDAAR